MAASITAATVSSWVLAVVLHWLTDPRQLTPALAPLLHAPAHGFQFPAAHVAVIAAVVTAAAPYLRRRVRTLGWVVVVLVAFGEVFLGSNLPVGAFAGAVLGWGVGTVLHVLLGAPGRRTSEQAVQLALAEAGISDAKVAPRQRRWLRPYEYDITADGQPMLMRVVRRLHRQAGPISRARRLLASVESRREPVLTTASHEVEHEAYITLIAERAGVGVLPVVFAGDIAQGPPFLIQRCVPGTPLSRFAADDVDDALLDVIWRDVLLLGEHHVAHNGLRACNILIDTQGRPRITNFTFSHVGGQAGPVPQDIAELLVALASVVGVDRAVSSAARQVPESALEAALPNLQWLALHRRMRRQLPRDRATLSELRLVLAEHLDSSVPGLRSPVRPTTLVILLAVGLAIYLLLPQLSDVRAVRGFLVNADWWWIAAAIVTGFLGIAASGMTVVGSCTKKLPWGKTMAVQLAAAFTGRTTAAGVGFWGINVLFLERLGLRRAQAAGAVILNRTVVGLVTAVATVIGLFIIGGSAPLGEVQIPTGWPVITVAAVIVAAIAVVLALPPVRRRLWPRLVSLVRDAVRDLVPTLSNPARFAELVGGSMLFIALQSAGLAATLAAFQPGFPVLAVLAVAIVGSTIGQLVPTPGGLGSVEAATVAGLTAIGVSPAAAIAAVLTSRALTFWLPVLPGIAAFRLLQHRGVV